MKSVGIHWPDLDEDISVENLIFGKPSRESPRTTAMKLSVKNFVPALDTPVAVR